MMDLLYQFTEWLRGTFMVDVALWLGETSLSLWIVQSFWNIPVIQTFHILFLGLAFGSVLMMNLRVLGAASTHLTMADTQSRFLPVLRWSFLGLAVSGTLLIIGEPYRELVNPIFWIKVALIIIGIIAAIWFQKAAKAVDTAGGASGGLRFGAVFIIVLWLAIMAGGRWIAYAPL